MWRGKRPAGNAKAGAAAGFRLARGSGSRWAHDSACCQGSWMISPFKLLKTRKLLSCDRKSVDHAAGAVLNSYRSKRIADLSPAFLTMGPFTASLSGICLSNQTGHAMQASTACPGRRRRVVAKSRPELLIFTVSLIAQSEPAGDPSQRYLTANRNGKRRLVRRSLASGVDSPPFFSGDMTGTSLRANVCWGLQFLFVKVLEPHRLSKKTTDRIGGGTDGPQDEFADFIHVERSDFLMN
jgi:hypothetical protein